MLLDTIQQSRSALGQIAFKNNDRILMNNMAIRESFDNYIHLLRQEDVESADSLPDWPAELTAISDGIFKKGEKIICVRTIDKGLFPYLAFYALGRNQPSKHIVDLSGKYINVLRKCADGLHYEPEAFSYLVMDEYFKTKKPRNIFPCLILPSVIPEPLEFQWVYIAMRYMNMELSPSIDYHYLAEDEKEINLLKEYGIY